MRNQLFLQGYTRKAPGALHTTPEPSDETAVFAVEGVLSRLPGPYRCSIKRTNQTGQRRTADHVTSGRVSRDILAGVWTDPTNKKGTISAIKKNAKIVSSAMSYLFFLVVGLFWGLLCGVCDARGIMRNDRTIMQLLAGLAGYGIAFALFFGEPAGGNLLLKLIVVVTVSQLVHSYSRGFLQGVRQQS